MIEYLLVPIGFVAGILAGYLGIGGGGMFVPVLFFFIAGNCPNDLLPKLSVGTSKGAIIFTAVAGAFRHWQLDHINWRFWGRLALGASIGAFFGGIIVRSIPGGTLTYIISAVLILAAVRMLNSKEVSESHLREMKLWWLPYVGVFVGLISSTVGVGGGIFVVPFLAGVIGLKTKNAAGTSAAMTVVVSSSSVLGHIFWGRGVPGLPDGCAGFVFVKYAFLLGIPAVFGALIGAGLHNKFKPKVFKWIFAALLITVAIKIAFF